jgi:hypothetical protein
MAAVSYGSSPPPTDVTTLGSKESFVTTGATIGTTETTIIIPANVKAFRLHTASGSSIAKLTISNVLNGTTSTTTSWDLKHGNIWQEEGLAGTNALTIYIKSNKASTDVQLMYWL